ncbi:MAG: cytochrome c family protein [Pseudomonadota bacterium]|nr:cytochrome c family protein [Pseudomonadota bacterium]
MKFFFILIIYLISTSSLAHSKQVRWLAFGDIRGHVESCGCDPATDLGGIGRLNYFLTLEAQANKPFLLFSLGNNLASETVKNNAINAMLAKLDLTAALLNERELLAAELAGNYLLSNLPKGSPHAERKNIRKYVSTDREIIFGYLFNQRVATQVRKFDDQLLQEWQTLIAKHRKQQSYLLFAGSLEHLRALLARAQVYKIKFEQVLMANHASFDTTPTHKEKNAPHLLTHKIGDNQVYMTPLAAQGVLRGGAMLHNEASLLFAKKPANDGLFGKRVTWLDKRYNDQSAKFWQDYLKAQDHEFKRREQEGVKHLASSQFTGALACKGCHVKEYLVWEQSKHAQAMQTLVAKNRHLNVDCVACHSVGFGSGGYVSEKFTNHLAGVQCENCHGAGIEHIKSGGKVKTPHGKGFNCIACHHPPHTADFNQQLYWQKIKH